MTDKPISTLHSVEMIELGFPELSSQVKIVHEKTESMTAFRRRVALIFNAALKTFFERINNNKAV